MFPGFDGDLPRHRVVNGWIDAMVPRGFSLCRSLRPTRWHCSVRRPSWRAWPTLTVSDIDLCPACKVGRLRVVAVMKGSQRLPGPGVVLTPSEQGPQREA